MDFILFFMTKVNSKKNVILFVIKNIRDKYFKPPTHPPYSNYIWCFCFVLFLHQRNQYLITYFLPGFRETSAQMRHRSYTSFTFFARGWRCFLHNLLHLEGEEEARENPEVPVAASDSDRRACSGTGWRPVSCGCSVNAEPTLDESPSWRSRTSGLGSGTRTGRSRRAGLMVTLLWSRSPGN